MEYNVKTVNTSKDLLAAWLDYPMSAKYDPI